MIDHARISVADMVRATAFYDRALAPLGIGLLARVPLEYTDGVNICGYAQTRPQFWLSETGPQSPPVHFAFTADSRATVDEFYKTAINAGGADNGAPGLRPQYHADYYGAFVRDPDGNNIEAVRHRPEQTGFSPCAVRFPPACRAAWPRSNSRAHTT